MIAESTTKTVYVERVETDADIRSELEAKYDAVIRDLHEQVEDWKQIAQSVSEEQKAELVEPLPKLTAIQYFGLPNAALFAYLLKYNIVDVASHKVWELIKMKKPLIISGSNKELLAERIVRWLAHS